LDESDGSLTQIKKELTAHLPCRISPCGNANPCRPLMLALGHKHTFRVLTDVRFTAQRDIGPHRAKSGHSTFVG